MLQTRVGTEIDEESKLVSPSVKIIHDLRTVVAGENRNRFDLDNDIFVTEKIRSETVLQRRLLVKKWQINL